MQAAFAPRQGGDQPKSGPSGKNEANLGPGVRKRNGSSRIRSAVNRPPIGQDKSHGDAFGSQRGTFAL